MLVYKLDKQGVYIKDHNCQKCPETKVWLYPSSYATQKPPTIGKFEKAVYDGSNWAIEICYIDKPIYDISTAKRTVCKADYIPDGFTDVVPPIPFYHEYKNKKWSVVNAKKDEYDLMIIEEEKEVLIHNKIRQIAIDALIADGEWI